MVCSQNPIEFVVKIQSSCCQFGTKLLTFCYQGDSKHRSVELISDTKPIIFSYLQHEKSGVILVAIAIKMNRSASINSIERLLVTSTSWAMTTILMARSSMIATSCKIIIIASSWNTMSDLYRCYGDKWQICRSWILSINSIRTLNQRDGTWGDKRDSRNERENYRELCDAQRIFQLNANL